MRNAEFGYVISDLGLRIYKMDFFDFTFLNPSLDLMNNPAASDGVSNRKF